jgi:hypothetical protein
MTVRVSKLILENKMTTFLRNSIMAISLLKIIKKSKWMKITFINIKELYLKNNKKKALNIF